MGSFLDGGGDPADASLTAQADGPLADAPAPGVEAGRCDPAARRKLGAPCLCADECASGFCADGVCCNSQCTGACVSCDLPSTRGECAPARAGATDPHGACTRQGAETCGFDGTCTGTGACAKHKAGTVCKAAACSGSGLTPASTCDGNGTCQTSAPVNCSPSVCANGACKSTCASSADCAPPHQCTNGSCGLRGPGQSCAGGAECKSGFCADGVCCDTACTGKCTSCALPSSPGICTPVPAGVLDPRAAAGAAEPSAVCADQGAASCGTNGRCDGAGGCQRYADGTTCREQSCDPATNGWTAQSVCTSGACVTPPARDCQPYKCSGNRCGSSCTTKAECSQGDCVGGSCGKKPLGSLCAADVECASSFCAQGVCCIGRCDGVCQQCNTPGLQGFCTWVAAGGQDPSSTCVDQGVSSCGTDGTCNGLGACRKYRAGTRCAEARCTDGVVTGASTCDSAGRCQPGPVTQCAGIMCDPAKPQCLSGCSRDDQCIAPNTCQGGRCGQSGPGGTCQDDADCKQTPKPQFCVSGACCNVSACSGCKTCQTGTCLNVSANAPPPQGGCAVDPANPICGNNGTCDGSGKCKTAAVGTACGTTCSGDSRVASTCPGDGALCAAGAPMSCGAYTCHAGACLVAPCTSDGDCAAGKICVGGACKTCDPANNRGCGVGLICPTGDACKVPLGGTCSASGQCAQGACVGTPSRCCDCPAPNLCTDAGCTAAGVCNYHPAGSPCSTPICNNAKNAFLANLCNGAGACSGSAMTVMCPMSAPLCLNGGCAPLTGAGGDCSGDNECVSGACLTGKCCTAACVTGGLCGATACNGSGACVYPAATTTCGAPSCHGETTSRQPKCDGLGACKDVDTPCADGLKCSGAGVCGPP